MLFSTTTDNKIEAQYIKVKVNDNEIITLNSLTNGIILSDITLKPDEYIDVTLRVWLDINTPNTQIGKTFNAKITTEGQAIYTEEEVKLDVSLDDIIIDKGSKDNTIIVSGGGLTNSKEIDDSLSITITGTTTKNEIKVNGGKSNIIINNVNITNITSNDDGSGKGTLGIFNDAEVNLSLVGINKFEAIGCASISPCGVGIYVDTDAKLTIDGDGQVTVIGYGSGIGSVFSNGSGASGGGTIIINSGIINASSIGKGAGIGAGKFLEINGGNITAIGASGSDTSDGGGAGIGGCLLDSINGTIIINGGTVYAEGGLASAGIGAGGVLFQDCYNETASGITISPNANVTAIGCTSSGIGDGCSMC